MNRDSISVIRASRLTAYRILDSEPLNDAAPRHQPRGVQADRSVHRRINEHPENESFSGRQNTAVRTRRPANPSSIQTITVGLGISPGHAVRKHCASLWLVGYTTDREIHPAPKVDIQLGRFYHRLGMHRTIQCRASCHRHEKRDGREFFSAIISPCSVRKTSCPWCATPRSAPTSCPPGSTNPRPS